MNTPELHWSPSYGLLARLDGGGYRSFPIAALGYEGTRFTDRLPGDARPIPAAGPVGYLCARPHPDQNEVEFLGVVDAEGMTNLARTPAEAASLRSLYGVDADPETWPVLALTVVEGA